MTSDSNANDRLAGLDQRVQPATEQRGMDRRSVSATVSFRRPGHKASALSLRDLSVSGCRFTTYVRAVVGEQVWISLPGLESIVATVRWVADNDCGCEFDHALYPAVLETILPRLRR